MRKISLGRVDILGRRKKKWHLTPPQHKYSALALSTVALGVAVRTAIEASATNPPSPASVWPAS